MRIYVGPTPASGIEESVKMVIGGLMDLLLNMRMVGR